MLLATLREPPKAGSLRESILILLILKKDEIEAHKTRALLQAVVKQDAGPEAFQDFFRAAFPWVRIAKKREEAEIIQRLQEEIKKGPLAVFAQRDTYRSRLKDRVTRRVEAGPLISKLTSKITPTIPR